MKRRACPERRCRIHGWIHHYRTPPLRHPPHSRHRLRRSVIVGWWWRRWFVARSVRPFLPLGVFAWCMLATATSVTASVGILWRVVGRATGGPRTSNRHNTSARHMQCWNSRGLSGGLRHWHLCSCWHYHLRNNWGTTGIRPTKSREQCRLSQSTRHFVTDSLLHVCLKLLD